MIDEPSTPSYRIAFCSIARPLNRTSCHVPVPEFTEPGACSISCDICRPLIGRFSTSRSLTLTPIRAELRSMELVVPWTVTVSVTPAGLSSKIEMELLSGEQLHAGVFQWREVAGLRANGVGRRLEVGDDVEALRAARRGAFLAGLFVLHRNGRTRNECAARVEDGSREPTVRLRARAAAPMSATPARPVVKAFSTRSFVIIASVSWSYLPVFWCQLRSGCNGRATGARRPDVNSANPAVMTNAAARASDDADVTQA